MIGILTTNAAILVAVIIFLWLISIRLRDVSFIDSFWPLGMVMLAVTTFAQAHDGASPRKMLLLVLTGLWGLRLSIHLFTRWRAEGEDPRYKRILGGAMEKKAKNGEMGYREHGAVNRRMKALYGRLMNLPVHVVATAHEAVQYEGTGNSLRKVGVKPDADKSIAYAFDFVINTQRNGKGVVWKGRGSKELEEGKVVSGVTWELFKDIAKSNATGEAVKALNDEEAIANEAARIAAAEDLTAATNSMIAELVASELYDDVNAIGAAVAVLKRANPALSFEADPVGFKAALVDYAQKQKAA